MAQKILLLASLFLVVACQNSKEKLAEEKTPYKIVFVTGDEEYRSEESMPMLAKIVARELGAEVEVLFSVDSAGFIDPNRTDHIAGLESLDSADLMVLFTRFRNLPPEEAAYITNFAESGKPMVGFRTATHAFFYQKDSSMMHLNNEWPTKVFGQQWISHHGHFDDGHDPMTRVELAAKSHNNPILNGVDSFQTFSWLYHVNGGAWQLHGEWHPILTGTSLRSKHAEADRLDEFPLQQPVAWTKTYQGSSAQEPARVFFTTLGHPYDFKIEDFRKFVVNGICWAAGREAEIPPAGFTVDFVSPYDPNNSGFGEKYKRGMKPGDFALGHY